MLKQEKNNVFFALKVERAGFSNRVKILSKGFLLNFYGSLIYFQESFYGESFSNPKRSIAVDISKRKLVCQKGKIVMFRLASKTNLIFEYRRAFKRLSVIGGVVHLSTQKNLKKPTMRVFCFRKKNKIKISIKKEIKFYLKF